MNQRPIQKEPSKGLVLSAFIALYLIWGSTYLANLYAIKSIPPFIMAGTRFFAAGFILFVWSIAKARKNTTIRLHLENLCLRSFDVVNWDRCSHMGRAIYS